MAENLAGRSCGGCNACCVGLQIDAPDLQKARGVWCEHCVPGIGCGIYDSRPQVCRDHKCVWLATDVLPDPCRPDVLGVMFSFEPNPMRDRPRKLCVVARSLGMFEKYFEPAVVQAVAALVRSGFDVHFSWGGTKTFIMPIHGADGALVGLELPDAQGKRIRRVGVGGSPL